MDSNERVSILQPPHAYFVELQTTRPIAPHVLESAFADEEDVDPKGNTVIVQERLGLNQSVLDVDGNHGFERATPTSPGLIRFITIPRRILPPRNVGALTWIQAFPIAFPIFTGLDYQSLSTMLRMVVSGATYDFRFYVRTKTFPDREKVIAVLIETGFLAPQALCLMKKDIRLPGQPASLSQWYARATWSQGDSALTDRDKILVDEMAQVKTSNSSNSERASAKAASPVSSESGPLRNP